MLVPPSAEPTGELQKTKMQIREHLFFLPTFRKSSAPTGRRNRFQGVWNRSFGRSRNAIFLSRVFTAGSPKTPEKVRSINLLWDIFAIFVIRGLESGSLMVRRAQNLSSRVSPHALLMIVTGTGNAIWCTGRMAVALFWQRLNGKVAFSWPLIAQDGQVRMYPQPLKSCSPVFRKDFSKVLRMIRARNFSITNR